LAAVLRSLRKERRLTQEKAAEWIGVSSKHLRRLELGDANVTLATLVACAAGYKVELSTLFERNR